MVIKTSEKTGLYNCIAWAAHEDDRWWWPGPSTTSFWPKSAPREVTLEAFIAAYATQGYEPCRDGILESGFQKIVIYANNGVPQHAARQLMNGVWTSKLGSDIDVQHSSPEALIHEITSVRHYGIPVLYLRRPRIE